MRSSHLDMDRRQSSCEASTQALDVQEDCEQGIESDRVSACMKTISLSADSARKASPVCSSKFATGDVVTLVANLDPNSAGLELGPRGIGSASPAQASLETR